MKDYWRIIMCTQALKHYIEEHTENYMKYIIFFKTIGILLLIGAVFLVISAFLIHHQLYVLTGALTVITFLTALEVKK